ILPYPTIASSGMHRLLALEHFRIERSEKLLVQRGHRAVQIRLGHNEADVEQRSALADHADIDAVERIEGTARDPRGVTDVLADQTDNDAIVLDGDFGELTNFAYDQVDLRGVINREGNAHFTRCDHIDRGFVAVENFEDAAQESVRHEHAGGVDVD